MGSGWGRGVLEEEIPLSLGEGGVLWLTFFSDPPKTVSRC